MRALPDALPQGAVLAIYPPVEKIAAEYRKLGGKEQVFAGGLFTKPSSMFWLPPTAANIERICELKDTDLKFSRALNVEAFTSSEAVMSWTVMFDHHPWFSAAIDVERLRHLASLCTGNLSEPIMEGELKKDFRFVEFKRIPRG